MDSLRALAEKPGCKGIAVIITNDYTTTSADCLLPPLPGTQLDGKNLSTQFSRFGYAVYWKTNVSIDEFKSIMREIQHDLDYKSVKGFDSIFFIFSGHGCVDDNLYMQDGKKVHINKDFISPLLPKSLPKIGNVPKIFLIDACRGKEETKCVLVPRGTVEETSSRGGKELITRLVPEEGNIFVAFSTMPKSRAYEDSKKGGMWFSTLAEELKSLNEKRSIDDILTGVNSKMVEKNDHQIQQPEKLSRLNKVVFLTPDPTIYALSSSTPPSSQEPGYKLMLSRLARSKGMHVTYLDTEHYDEKYKDTVYYHSTVTLAPISGTSGGLKCGSRECYQSPELSKEDAAKVAYQNITTASTATFNTSEATVISQQHPSPHPVVSQVPNPSNERAKLNYFFQKNGVKPKYSYDEDHSTGQPRFKCTIVFMWNGKTVRPDSGGFHSRKDDAKERASSKAFLIVGDGIQSRGGVPTLTATNVSWKSRLKEFYDKRGQPEIQLDYQTERVVAGDIFVSSIFIPEPLGREVKGEPRKSKKEAEQDAACESLQLLFELA